MQTWSADPMVARGAVGHAQLRSCGCSEADERTNGQTVPGVLHGNDESCKATRRTRNLRGTAERAHTRPIARDDGMGLLMAADGLRALFAFCSCGHSASETNDVRPPTAVCAFRLELEAIHGMYLTSPDLGYVRAGRRSLHAAAPVRCTLQSQIQARISRHQLEGQGK